MGLLELVRNLLIVGFALLALWGLYLIITGQDPNRLLKRETSRLITQNKAKAPVVYLRSFAAEGLHLSDVLKGMFLGRTIPGSMAYWKDAGDVVTSALRVIGPPLELLRPGGAWRLKPWSPSRPERIRVDDDHWQAQILEWFSRAALVVVQLDNSPGLMWELAELVRTVSPIKVLLVLPPTQGEYATLCASVANVFPRPFPERLPSSRLLTFRPDWKPMVLEAQTGLAGIWLTLEPVFEQNRFEVPAWRRIYG